MGVDRVGRGYEAGVRSRSCATLRLEGNALVIARVSGVAPQAGLNNQATYKKNSLSCRSCAAAVPWHASTYYLPALQ